MEKLRVGGGGGTYGQQFSIFNIVQSYNLESTLYLKAGQKSFIFQVL
jgi:hypothetical protein